MEPFAKEKEFSIVSGTASFEDWIRALCIGDNLRKRLESANVLIVPMNGFGQYDEPLFVAGTDDLLQYFKRLESDEILLEVCVEDEDYTELSLHSDLIRLGSFVVKNVVLPLFLNLLSAYVYEKVLSRPEESWVHVEVTAINRFGDSKIVKFKGPVTTFKAEIVDSVDSVFNLEHIDNDIEDDN